ncbi:MAG: hypothetical protein ACI4M3_04190 [Acutalibacteraceae bacterium]
MKNDLINGLIKKYSDKILIADSGKVIDKDKDKTRPISDNRKLPTPRDDELPF